MVAFVAQHFVLVAAAWALLPFEPRFVIPAAVLLSLSAWICAIVAHNTLHCPVFRSRALQSAFQIAVTCGYGFPVSEYLPGHNLSHHRHLQKPADLMRTSKAPFVRLNALNLLWFFPRVAIDILQQNRLYAAAMAERAPAWRRQLKRETVACWATKAALLLLGWQHALVYIVLPHAFAVYAITTTNLLQHDGCDENDALNHSRNFVGRAFNWLTFNNGFHSVHHDTPGLHWTLLADAHRARYQGRIAPALEQRSLLVYLVRTYLLSAQRRRYDGTAITSITQTPDESWIPRSVPLTGEVSSIR